MVRVNMNYQASRVSNTNQGISDSLFKIDITFTVNMISRMRMVKMDTL